MKGSSSLIFVFRSCRARLLYPAFSRCIQLLRGFDPTIDISSRSQPDAVLADSRAQPPSPGLVGSIWRALLKRLK